MTASDPSQGTRVLIVDDDEDVRNVLRRSLQRGGFEVVGEASNGIDGADLAGALQPAVVILDSSMPVMDGEEASRLIRQRSPNAAIVAYSGALNSCPPWADAYLNKGSSGLIENLVSVVGIAALGKDLQ